MPPTVFYDKGLSADWCLIKRSAHSRLKDIVRVQNYREYIIEYTATRLTLTKQKAVKDSYLQDEYFAQSKDIASGLINDHPQQEFTTITLTKSSDF